MRGFAFGLPHPFRLVPALDTQGFVAWSEGMLNEHPGRPSSSLGTDLHRLSEAMHADPSVEHRWFAAIPDPPYRAGIAAFGWIAGSTARGLTRAALAERADESAPGDAGSLYSRVSLHSVGTATALVISQFQSARGSSNALLIERCGALMLDAAADTVITLELVAIDLRSFDDIVSTSLQILESLSWTEVRA